MSQSGRKGAVTISTNMAGRGTDIILGGNADFMARLKLREMLMPEVVSNVEAEGAAKNGKLKVSRAAKGARGGGCRRCAIQQARVTMLFTALVSAVGLLEASGRCTALILLHVYRETRDDLGLSSSLAKQLPPAGSSLPVQRPFAMTRAFLVSAVR